MVRLQRCRSPWLPRDARDSSTGGARPRPGCVVPVTPGHPGALLGSAVLLGKELRADRLPFAGDGGASDRRPAEGVRDLPSRSRPAVRRRAARNRPRPYDREAQGARVRPRLQHPGPGCSVASGRRGAPASRGAQRPLLADQCRGAGLQLDAMGARRRPDPGPSSKVTIAGTSPGSRARSPEPVARQTRRDAPAGGVGLARSGSTRAIARARRTPRRG